MPLRRKILPTFEGVTANEIATCNLSLGRKYLTKWLRFGSAAGLALGDLVDEIRIILDGKPQRRMRATELNDLNALMGPEFGMKTIGVQGTPDYSILLPIYYAEPWRKIPAEGAAMGWNLSGQEIRSASVEVQFKDVDDDGITLNGWYEYAPLDGPIGQITKWIRHAFGVQGTEQDFDTLTRKDFYHSIHFFPTTEGTIRYVNKLRATVNGEILQDEITTEENQANLIAREMNPDTSETPRYDWVIDADDRLSGVLDARNLQEFNLHVEYSGAAQGNLPVIVQRTGPPD